MIIFRQKQYTMWDDTDRLKQMKDSDILAERKKSGTSGDTLKKAAMGAGVGGTIGATLGTISGFGTKGSRFRGAGRGFKSGGKTGMLAGGILAGTAAAIGNHQKEKEVSFYNNRLGYAQRQAARREKADWKNNMTNREGYTY